MLNLIRTAWSNASALASIRHEVAVIATTCFAAVSIVDGTIDSFKGKWNDARLDFTLAAVAAYAAHREGRILDLKKELRTVRYQMEHAEQLHKVSIALAGRRPGEDFMTAMARGGVPVTLVAEVKTGDQAEGSIDRDRPPSTRTLQ